MPAISVFFLSPLLPGKSSTGYCWNQHGLEIPNTNNFRDFGTHLNLTRNTSGVTLTARMLKAIDMAKRLARLPITTEFRERVLQSNVLPAALYGCEAAHINTSAFNKLITAIVAAIEPHSTRRSTDFVFLFTSTAKDLDPESYVLYNRVVALRRQVAKKQGAKVTIQQSIMAYNSVPKTSWNRRDLLVSLLISSGHTIAQ